MGWGCLPAVAGRVHSDWLGSYGALYLRRAVMGEGAEQLKRDVDVLVQHRERRGNYREVSTCKLGFLRSEDVNLHPEEG